jgi:hypothetical protein
MAIIFANTGLIEELSYVAIFDFGSLHEDTDEADDR